MALSPGFFKLKAGAFMNIFIRRILSLLLIAGLVVEPAAASGRTPGAAGIQPLGTAQEIFRGHALMLRPIDFFWEHASDLRVKIAVYAAAGSLLIASLRHPHALAASLALLGTDFIEPRPENDRKRYETAVLALETMRKSWESKKGSPEAAQLLKYLGDLQDGTQTDHRTIADLLTWAVGLPWPETEHSKADVYGLVTLILRNFAVPAGWDNVWAGAWTAVLKQSAFLTVTGMMRLLDSLAGIKNSGPFLMAHLGMILEHTPLRGDLLVHSKILEIAKQYPREEEWTQDGWAALMGNNVNISEKLIVEALKAYASDSHYSKIFLSEQITRLLQGSSWGKNKQILFEASLSILETELAKKWNPALGKAWEAILAANAPGELIGKAWATLEGSGREVPRAWLEEQRNRFLPPAPNKKIAVFNDPRIGKQLIKDSNKIAENLNRHTRRGETTMPVWEFPNKKQRAWHLEVVDIGWVRYAIETRRINAYAWGKGDEQIIIYVESEPPTSETGGASFTAALLLLFVPGIHLAPIWLHAIIMILFSVGFLAMAWQGRVHRPSSWWEKLDRSSWSDEDQDIYSQLDTILKRLQSKNFSSENVKSVDKLNKEFSEPSEPFKHLAENNPDLLRLLFFTTHWVRQTIPSRMHSLAAAA